MQPHRDPLAIAGRLGSPIAQPGRLHVEQPLVERHFDHQFAERTAEDLILEDGMGVDDAVAHVDGDCVGYVGQTAGLVGAARLGLPTDREPIGGSQGRAEPRGVLLGL